MYMRLLRRIFLLFLCIIGFYYIFTESDAIHNLLKQNMSSSHLNKSKISLELKTSNNRFKKIDHSNFIQWIDKSSSDLIEEFGEPKRKDLSAYGYTWWIYPHLDGYAQFGIDKNHKIETIYARGFDIPIKDLKNKQSYDQLNNVLSFERKVNYRHHLSSFTFHLTEDDLIQRPLIHLSEDIFMQLYFDTFTNNLSSFRISKADTLLKHIPYEVQYRGKLPEKPVLTDQQWDEIDRGMEQQIFDLTNVIRSEFQINHVEWEKPLHEVAFMHSKDMSNNNYFSHYTPDGEGLKERLATKEVFYQSAGENIATQYPDGLAAVEGWLNSKGHREAILDESYTHLGVGVYRLYYTQNFIKKTK